MRLNGIFTTIKFVMIISYAGTFGMEEDPRPYLYKSGKNQNQKWEIYRKDNQMIFRSKSGDQLGLSYSGSNVFLDRKPYPFIFQKHTLLDKGMAKKQYIPDNNQLVENAWKLWSTYDKGYAFPEWTIEKLQTEFYKLAPKCRLYFSNGSKEEAITLATQREPVNIAMERQYDEYKLEKLFGWSRGYYGDYYKKTNRLAPNIAIYCPTLVKIGNIYKTVHMINSIGYAFDSKRQPDFQVLTKLSPSVLYDRYKLVFEKIFVCARDIGADTIVMSLVGAGVFAEHWPNLYKDIWLPAFERVAENHSWINVMFMAPYETKTPRKNIGLFPDNVLKVYNLERTLFVNAWDPWSIAGNGNSKDNSLDGYVGRNSMVAVLTWPKTNPEVLKNVKEIR